MRSTRDLSRTIGPFGVRPSATTAAQPEWAATPMAATGGLIRDSSHPHIKINTAMNTAYSAASGMSHRASTSRFENSASNAATATDVMMPETTSSRENIHVVKNNPK